MDLEQAKNLIQNKLALRERELEPVRVARRYYRCQNDIMFKVPPNPHGHAFRKSCHRIASNFFKVLVDQKAAYMGGEPPVVDVGSAQTNDFIKETLGEQWGKNFKTIIRHFSVDGESWIQWWKDPEDGFKYGVVTVADFEPVWGGPLGDDLVLGLKFAFNWIDPETGEMWDTYEIWDRERCYAYKTESGADVSTLIEDCRWVYPDPDFDQFGENGNGVESNVLEHGYGEVPFIRFRNNDLGLNDLVGIKEKIDSYDESMSGLADDISDSEETIFILSGYGDQDPAEFWENVSQNRLIKLFENPINSDAAGTGVQMLAVVPPIESRRFNIETLRPAIYEEGGGVDPKTEVLANTSGEALKHSYNLLELKAAAAEDECRVGLARLIRALCRVSGLPVPGKGQVKQVWKRTRINNDTELVANVRNSIDIVSKRTALKNHPFVEDVDEELRQLEREEREAERKMEERVTRDLIRSTNPGAAEGAEKDANEDADNEDANA